MKPEVNMRKFFKDATIKTNPEMDRAVLDKVLIAHRKTKKISSASMVPTIRRLIMKNPITKLTAAMVIIGVVALSITIVDKVTPPAYAIEQTVEALKNVKFLHIKGFDDAGQLNDERWIEIGIDGWQVRYRQQKSPSVIQQHPGTFSMVIEDGESTAVYRSDKQAVIIYDLKDMRYVWVGDLGTALENLRQKGRLLKENDVYHGHLTHKVWWPYLSAECYVDPKTKLPIAIGRMELSYEDPPAGTFEITIPEGYTVLDKRPGAPESPTPQWLQDEAKARADKAKCFQEGSLAFARGDYAEAAKQFKQALGYDSWAPFWLGKAYYELGQYDLAIENYNKVFEGWRKSGLDMTLFYCNYARGLAYAMSGDLKAATADFQACLPAMIRTLRIPSSGRMFERAEKPLMRYGQYNPTERQMVVNMINRLRIISGQSFGYNAVATDQENEPAIAAWEQWAKSSGKIKFTPDAQQVHVPESTESLHQAAAKGDNEQVKSLISQGADINAKNRTGDTPLHVAIANHKIETASLLIQKGADVNTKDRKGNTPLHAAAVKGDIKTANLLISKGADVNAENKYGLTPVSRALLSDGGGRLMVELLVSKGAKVSVLHLAAYRGDIDKVRSILEKGTNVDVRDKAGHTSLFYAASAGQLHVIEFLISKGADVNAKDNRGGEMPLFYAGDAGWKKVVELLIVKGADINARGDLGGSALESAAWLGRGDVAELLITKGADVNIRDDWGYIPLHAAACTGLVEIAERLIAKGNDINAKTEWGETPLQSAMWDSQIQMVKFLISKGADVNAQDSAGQTPLHKAAERGHSTVVDFLTSHGANVNARDNQGKTPLSLAKENGYAKLVILLKKHGAKE
jgi:ankyrin repeat protein